MNNYEKNIVRQEIAEYYRELALMQQEKLQMAEPVATIDPLWDCWYAIAVINEQRLVENNDVQVKLGTDVIAKEPVSEESFVDSYFDDIDIPVDPKASRRMHVSRRRRNTYLHKRKMGRNVVQIIDNYNERSKEDMMNCKYCKKRGGRYVTDPKSKTYQVDRILKQAKRMDAIPKEVYDIAMSILNIDKSSEPIEIPSADNTAKEKAA